MTTQKISKDIMKQYNQKLILRILKEKGSTSKSDLSKITGLTLPGVSDIIEELENLKLINNLGESRIKRGRFPTMFQLNEHSFKVIGVSIRSESIRAGLFTMLGTTLHYLEKELPTDTTPENIIDEVATLVNQILLDTNINRNEVNGIGVGMHGIVDYINGISVYPPHLNWENIPIRELLENKIQFPVLVDNDCNSLALAEYWFGSGRNLNSFITLNADYGVGAGIMIEGNLFHGRDFGAGQIGHTIIHDNGPLCSCGNYGCLETMSSEISIVENVKRRIKQGFPSSITNIEPDPNKITANQIYDAAASKDNLALTTLDSSSRYLGIGISTLVNVFNPDKVILTGGLLRGKNYVMKPLYDAFIRHALKTNVNQLEIVASELGREADVLGAASIWINELFKGELPLSEVKTNKAN